MRALLQAVAALAISGLGLLALGLVLTLPVFPKQVVRAERWYHPARPGASREDPSVWVLPALPITGHAVAQAGIRPLVADEYPFLRIRIEGRSAETEVAVLWRTDTRPTAINKYPLPWAGSSLSVLDLGFVRQWNGRVLNLGIAVGGRAPGPLRIHSLELASPSALGRLQAAWSAATAFEGWHAYSINFAYGGSPTNWSIGPLAVTAWVVLASIVLVVLQLVGRAPGALPFALVFLCGWLLLDARWQLDLARQQARTVHEYAGQSVMGKRASGDDGPLFRFLVSVKALIPKSPQRIVLIPSDQDPLRAKLLRTSYYLRPHNVYLEDLRPLCQGKLDVGDYVLALGTNRLFGYDAALHRLSWSDCPALPAQRVASTAVGQLFRIESAAPLTQTTGAP